MLKRNNVILIFLITLLSLPFNIFAAEILQIRSSTQLQIGDRNRSYTVNLACIEVESDNESLAIDWLKLNLKRGKRVNFKPEGSINGFLLARVSSVDGKSDFGNSLIEKGLAKSTC